MKLKEIILRKPHFVVWFYVLLVLSFCMLVKDTTADFSVSDWYLVISVFTLTIPIGFWLLLCGLGYFIVITLKKELSFLLTAIHLFFTLLALLGIYFPKLFVINTYDARNKHVYETILVDDQVLLLSCFVFFAVQILYFVNLFFAAVNKKA